LESVAGIVLAGAAAFAATNVDGLFLTAAFLSDRSTRIRDVVLGTYAGIGALYAVSAAGSLISLVVPPGAIALLGLIPLGLGIRQLLRPDSDANDKPPATHSVLAVAGINVACGGDNIGVYTPLFAASPGYAVALYGIVFAVLTGLLCFAAHRLVIHPGLGAPVRRYGPRLVPWVLIALGAWILASGLV
jgi:cadmium resistance protein CadD (predicted permease)